MPFEDLTLEQLRAATKEQIITKIVDKLTSMTKKRICEFIWAIKNIEIQDIKLKTLIKSEDALQGQIVREHKITDILDAKTGSQKTEWTYYDTGEVDIITISGLDNQNRVISQKKIKHFKNGKQPIVLEGKKHGYET